MSIFPFPTAKNVQFVLLYVALTLYVKIMENYLTYTPLFAHGSACGIVRQQMGTTSRCDTHSSAGCLYGVGVFGRNIPALLRGRYFILTLPPLFYPRSMHCFFSGALSASVFLPVPGRGSQRSQAHHTGGVAAEGRIVHTPGPEASGSGGGYFSNRRRELVP